MILQLNSGIPVFGCKRLRAGGGAARGASPPAVSHAQPLPEQAQGDRAPLPRVHGAARRVRVAADEARRGQPELRVAARHLPLRVRQSVRLNSLLEN